jgi:Putative esterase
VARHPVTSSTLKVLWLVGFLLVFGLALAFLVSSGSVPEGSVPPGSVPPGPLPHTAAAGSATASDNFSYLGTDVQGIQSYKVISADNGPGPQTVRVLTPTHPAPGTSHNFLIVLPVEAGLGNTFGDGLATLLALDAQDEYNLTIVEPSFAIDPWYANNPEDPHFRYETFMTRVLVPWIRKNLATTGHEQVWLIGFSKSGLGAQDLILKHPGVFTLAASWDSPFDMSAYDQFGNDSADNYGTDANFQANYRLTAAFVYAHRAPFLTSDRIWIGGYGLFQADDSGYDALLNSEGIAHSTETPQYMAHRWDSGWVPLALAALSQDSLDLHGGDKS